MDRYDIRAAEQLVLLDPLGATLRRLLGREVLAPGDHLHTHGGADPAHLGAQVAEPEDAERPPLQIEAQRGLPATAGPHGLELLSEVACQGDYEADGKLRRGPACTARVAYGHAVRLGRLQVDRRIA